MGRRRTKEEADEGGGDCVPDEVVHAPDKDVKAAADPSIMGRI